jgi:hypothetical protein
MLMCRHALQTVDAKARLNRACTKTSPSNSPETITWITTFFGCQKKSMQTHELFRAGTVIDMLLCIALQGSIPVLLTATRTLQGR